MRGEQAVWGGCHHRVVVGRLRVRIERIAPVRHHRVVVGRLRVRIAPVQSSWGGGDHA